MEQQEKHTFRKRWVFILLEFLIVIFAIAIGFLGSRLFFRDKESFNLLKEAKDILIDNTILELPDETNLEYGMIRGMLQTTGDPHTYFVEPASTEIQADDLSGSFGGIGIRLERDIQSNWRIYPLPDSPAFKAGIQDADLLLRVEDLSITSAIEQIDIIAKIRGPLDEKLEIEIERNNQNYTYTIKRETILLPSVTWNILPDAPQVGLFKINRIAETTGEEIQEGFDTLLQNGAKLFILDLQDNGGGLVEEGIEISALFLTEGEIIRRQFKDQDIEIFPVEKAGKYATYPLVVLINENTASAAEIIAGALSNHTSATLIGRPTYGKTTIQYVFTLQDGSSIHVTSGKWWIPDVAFPLQPDILIQSDATEEDVLRLLIDTLISP